MPHLHRLALAAAALFAASAALAAGPYKTSFGPTTVDISTGHAGHSSIPRKMGYWAADNVEVDVFGAAGAVAGLQMVASGKMDFITVTAEALMQAQAQGMPVQAFYVHARAPISKLVVPKDSAIKSVKDLQGKTIGMPVLEASSGYFGGLFREAGLAFGKDVKIIATGTGAPPALALQRGDIVAWAAWDTAVASLENRGAQFTEFKPGFYDDLVGNVIVTRTEMLEKHPEVVVAVGRGIAKAVHFGLANPEGAIKIHWEVYPQTKPQNADPAVAMKDAMSVFVSRFDSYKLAPGMQYGAARPEQWDTIARLAREAGANLPASYNPRQAYTDRFIAEINRFDRNAVEAQARNYR
ncbi:ABC transporter substrate-binding protein [Pseudorhodoferax soli]|uniref:NitT/TauT family transport system substrate-binding protein n=1 Tax=Pseudorhodoferax soli TaxID=545864 RepID=A0A368XU78_9BURK|nr:ABC transporter substrate-binding protein [Pseudorhodoferax soli]RCW70588.1 NitT/TauT family transport system substrate-binding protein [Pseudorhodoferax soli]